MKVGDTCYLVISNFSIEEVVIRKILGNIYTVKFLNSNKAIRVPKHRLFTTKEEAELSVPEDDSVYRKTNRPPGMH